MDEMGNTLEQTRLGTISLLEARLQRIERILYGPSEPPIEAPLESATSSLAELERRFAVILQHFRVYAEILKICTTRLYSTPTQHLANSSADKTHPSLFQPPSTDSPPPTELSPEALQATVLSYASSFPSIASALTAVTSDTPVPDPKLSAELASLVPRMKGVKAVQLAQEADIAELRARSERVMREWYEGRVLRYGQFVADVEGRVEKAEMATRRAQRAREMDSAI